MISKTTIRVIILLAAINVAYAQENKIYQKGITAEQNLKAIVNVSPYSPGGMGFDTRYEGIKGSPRLYDSLLTSAVKIKGQKDYFELQTDIDLVSNSLIFSYPKGAKLQSIPAEMISEVIINKDGKDHIFRTEEGNRFDKSVKDKKFFEILTELPYPFIKVYVKTFTEADYKGLYTSDRRYDEYGTIFRYYILTSDGNYHKIQLSKNSLARLFPDKKDFIKKFPGEDTYPNEEEFIKAILSKLNDI